MRRYNNATGRIVVRGRAPYKVPQNIGVAANMYAGRLVVKELTDYDVKVADALLPPVGVLGYEDTAENFRPATIDDIYTVDTEAMVLGGGGFAFRGKLPAGFEAGLGDLLFSWADGMVVPGALIRGMPAIKVPFTKNTSVKDTGIDLPGGILVHDCAVNVVTADASGTIDVGIINAVESGDEDGFLDGESLAATGFRAHNLVDDADSKLTLGAYLMEAPIKSADSTALYFRPSLLPGYKTTGTAKSLCYVTSNHTVAGYLYLMVSSPGIVPVGKAGESLSASATAQNIFVEAVI